MANRVLNRSVQAVSAVAYYAQTQPALASISEYNLTNRIQKSILQYTLVCTAHVRVRILHYACAGCDSLHTFVRNIFFLDFFRSKKAATAQGACTGSKTTSGQVAPFMEAQA
jgi:hypothetical protein